MRAARPCPRATSAPPRDDRQHLYLSLEDLAGERTGDREEAMFNLGFEHGQLEGGADSFAALWQKDEELRGLAAHVARLIVNARVEHRQAAAVLLEITWSMLVAQDLPSASQSVIGPHARAQPVRRSEPQRCRSAPRR
jgi:hypothetical protein